MSYLGIWDKKKNIFELAYIGLKYQYIHFIKHLDENIPRKVLEWPNITSCLKPV